MNDLTLQERLQSLDAGASQGQGAAIDAIEYWRAIAKRRWSILGLTVVVSILTYLVTSAITPSYRGTATLLIEQGKNKVVSIEEVYSQGLIQREYYQTQAEILKSEELARKVVQRLKLTTHPDFDPRQAQPSIRNRITALVVPHEETTPNEDDILKGVVRHFRRELQVQLVRNSQLVQISFNAHDRQLAAAAPNTL